jgi:hypothetical protein
MADATLIALTRDGLRRLESEMRQVAPVMADRVLPWIRQLAGPNDPDCYFNQPGSFPTLLIPWWLANTCDCEPDRSFHADLVYSTLNGCYYIRLLDNLMDGESTVELTLLPATAFFHARFHGAYQPYFEAAHPFWAYFHHTWTKCADATIEDATLPSIDHSTFLKISAKKMCAARIPVAATCYRYGVPALIPAWEQVSDLLAAWVQMYDDLFDWHDDLLRGSQSYFLSEAARRKRADQSIAAWVVAEGFEWGIETLLKWLTELHEAARQVTSLDLQADLAERETRLRRQRDDLAGGLHMLAQLARSFDK